MNATLPAALAVAGAALMAVAIFGPFQRKTTEEPDEQKTSVTNGRVSQWPALVDASATACDVPARIDLAEGLGALQSPWAERILHQALEMESDPAVRSAIAAALSSSQSLVT